MLTTITDAAIARERLHHIIDEIEDIRVINLYEFLKDEEDKDDFIYTNEVKTRIEKVRDDYASERMENFLTEEQLHSRLELLGRGK